MKYSMMTSNLLLRESDIKISRTYLAHAIRSGAITLFDRPIDRDASQTEQDSPIKEILRELIAQTLEIDASTISDTANFFSDLGGDSLDYYTLVGYIDERFGIRLPFDSETLTYSINDLEKQIKELTSLHA